MTVSRVPAYAAYRSLLGPAFAGDRACVVQSLLRKYGRTDRRTYGRAELRYYLRAVIAVSVFTQ